MPEPKPPVLKREAILIQLTDAHATYFANQLT
jgi:hypothetical protein